MSAPRQEELVSGPISLRMQQYDGECRPSYTLVADPLSFSAAYAPGRACICVLYSGVCTPRVYAQLARETKREAGQPASQPANSYTVSGTPCRTMTRGPLYSTARAHGQQVVRSPGSHINRHSRDHPWTDRGSPRLRSPTRRRRRHP